MKFAGVKSPKRRVSGVSGTSHLTFSAVPSASSFRFSGALAKRSSFLLDRGRGEKLQQPLPSLIGTSGRFWQGAPLAL